MARVGWPTVWAVMTLAFLRQADASDPFAPCCFVQALGRVDNETCMCLGDNTMVFAQLAANQSAHYHWRLTPENVDLAAAPDEVRFLNVRLMPCSGRATLLVNTIAVPMFPDNSSAEYRSSLWTDESLIRIPLESSQYFVTVYAETAANYTLVAITSNGVLPLPGANGTLAAWSPIPDRILLDGEPMDMQVDFTTAPELELEYQVYFVERRRDWSPCGTRTAKETPWACLMNTACGAMRVGRAVWTEFRQFPAGQEVEVLVPALARDVEHEFQVVGRNTSGYAGGLVLVGYVPVRGTPTFTRAVSAQAPIVVIIVFAIAGVIAVSLLVTGWFIKRHIRVQYKKLAPEQWEGIVPSSQPDVRTAVSRHPPSPSSTVTTPRITSVRAASPPSPVPTPSQSKPARFSLQSRRTEEVGDEL